MRALKDIDPYTDEVLLIEGYAAKRPAPKREPHIEATGKLCLPPIELPDDPVQAVKAALGDAIRLSAENEAGAHAEDFQEDFGLYWRHWHTGGLTVARILPAPTSKSHFGYCIATAKNVYAFASKGIAQRFWDNLSGNHVARPKRMAFIRIEPLPSPNRFPDDGKGLWELVSTRSPDGLPLLAEMVQTGAKDATIVLVGRAPSGREHYAALRLVLTPDQPKPVAKRLKRMLPALDRSPQVLCSRHSLLRLQTDRLDSARSRLPYLDRGVLRSKRVVLVGCGAIGAGVAKMIAQAGVEHLSLVDPETLAWENVRRHELGGRAVGIAKAKALAERLRSSLPEIEHIEGYQTSYHSFAEGWSRLADDADLTISCTGSWHADASVEARLRSHSAKGGAVYGWTEANALAAHTVYIGRDGGQLSDGFDPVGNFRLAALEGGRPAPPECGGATSPFGPVELSQAQNLVARMSIDALRGKVEPPSWRTWLADTAAMEEAEARWSEGWLRTRGEPLEWGGVTSGVWEFP
jgi:hypothetical protein